MSYPRTDGKHLSSEKAKEFSSLLRTVSAVPGMEPYLSSITPEAIQKAAANKRYVNDEEGQLLGYRITEHAEMYGSVICSTRKGMLTRLSATELTASML